MVGKLEMIVGPMRSNKTAELLRRIEIRRQYAHQYVLLLKPSADTKAAAGWVESRHPNGCGKMEAVEFPSSDPWSILPVLEATEQQVGKRFECIAIDEGQFVSDLFLFTKRLLQWEHDVLVSGLETGFPRHAFRRDAPTLLARPHLRGQSHGVGRLLQLRRQGFVPQRLVDGKPASYESPIIMAGDNYEPRCDQHLVLPGRPH